MDSASVAKLKLLQSLPLEVKILKSLQVIREFIHQYGHYAIYISFSGGKDSRVLAYLVHMVDPRIPLVFVDTKLEYPSLRRSVMIIPGVHIIFPDMQFPDVIAKYGYPVVSKKASGTIYKLRHHNLTDKYRNYLLNGDERGKTGMLAKKWQYLLYVDFEISAECCNIMKKKPFKKYVKESGRYAFFTGEMAEESLDRKKEYLKEGCNAFNRKGGPKSTPLGFWTEQDILAFIMMHPNEPMLQLPEIYGNIICDYKTGKLCTTGVSRSGCAYCAYGCSKKGDRRFEVLKEQEPELYDYCMRGGRYNENSIWIPHQGLGMAHVLDTLKVKY